LVDNIVEGIFPVERDASPLFLKAEKPSEPLVHYLYRYVSAGKQPFSLAQKYTWIPKKFLLLHLFPQTMR
jgi:hypothetical protein